MTVVAFKPKSKKSLDRVSHENWRDLISEEIRKKTRSGIKIRQIARDTGLCNSTISKLIYGETKFPRMETIVILLRYLGYKIYAENES